MLLVAILIPLLNALAKCLVALYSLAELLWVRYTGYLAMMLLVFGPKQGRALLASSKPVLQITRSLLFCGSTLLSFYALGFVPLGTAAAISFTAPFVVTALSSLVLGEKPGSARALAVSLSLCFSLRLFPSSQAAIL